LSGGRAVLVAGSWPRSEGTPTTARAISDPTIKRAKRRMGDPSDVLMKKKKGLVTRK
jgi:hypothetical protein